MFILFISSKTSSSQRVLGLSIGLLDMGFHLLIFCTLLSSAMHSTWSSQFSLCFLINPNIFCPLLTSLVVWWSESLPTNHETPRSIPGSTVGIFPEGEDSRGDHGLGKLVEFRFKGPPGTTSSYITTHIIGTT